MNPNTVAGFLQELAPRIDAQAQIPTHLLVSGLSKLDPAEFQAVSALAQAVTTQGPDPLSERILTYEEYQQLPEQAQNSYKKQMQQRLVEMLESLPYNPEQPGIHIDTLTLASLMRAPLPTIEDLKSRAQYHNFPFPKVDANGTFQYQGRLAHRALRLYLKMIDLIAGPAMWVAGWGRQMERYLPEYADILADANMHRDRKNPHRTLLGKLTPDQYRRVAYNMVRGMDNVSIPSDAKVDLVDGGAYVQALIWVPDAS